MLKLPKIKDLAPLTTTLIQAFLFRDEKVDNYGQQEIT